MPKSPPRATPKQRRPLIAKQSLQPPLTFEGLEIRTTPDGLVAATDVLAAFGQKDAPAAWRNLKKQHKDLMEESSIYSFGGRGRPSEVLTRKGVFKLLMVANGPRAAEFREWASVTLIAFLDADIHVADSIVQRNNTVEQLEWLRERLEGKLARNLFTGAIKRHGGEGGIYRDASSCTNKSILGMSAKDYKAMTGAKNTRDGMPAYMLTRFKYVESTSAEAMDKRNVQGNAEISAIHQMVVEAEAQLWQRVMNARL